MERPSVGLKFKFPVLGLGYHVGPFSFGRRRMRSLPRMYGFVVVDYNFEGVVQCSRVARAAISVAARATGVLGRLAGERHDLAVQSDCLMREVSLLNLLV